MKLFESFSFSGHKLSSRIVMAPLTRRRCNKDNTPVDIMTEYYSQRSGAGLIIAEGTSPSINGTGYCNMPGLFNKPQMEAWKASIKAVHENGGKIFLQVMHTGRVGHINNLLKGGRILGPSAIPQEGELSTYDFDKQDYSIPEEMSLKDISESIHEFSECAKLAVEAGFDGVEIHGAHGYLPNQFINKSSNIRNDKYGGSIKNRLRYLIEVIDAVIDAIGKEKVALRVSPYSYADVLESSIDLRETYLELTKALNNKGLAYLHLSHMGEPIKNKFELWKEIRGIYNGVLMLCGDFTKQSAASAINNNKADLIAFGRDFIANPDLVERFKNNWPLAQRDRASWYTSDSKGYIDYPDYQNDI